MKKNKHPKYQKVVFKDSSTGYCFATGSAAKTSDERMMFEGEELPVIKVPVSSSSHPFFNGNQQPVDLEGRLDKFNRKYGRTQAKAVEQPSAG